MSTHTHLWEPYPHDGGWICSVCKATTKTPQFVSVPSAEQDTPQVRTPDDTLLARIPYHEPIFVLRAQDALAVDTIKAWIALAGSAGVSQDKIDAAKRHLFAIIDWQRKHPHCVKTSD